MVHIMKKILRQVLATVLVMTCILQLCIVPTNAAGIESGSSSVDEIELLGKLGFVSKSYGPKKGEDTVTRAQFANILGYLRGFDENVVNQGTQFMDISDDHWCADQIYALYDVGLINGTTVNTFSPNDLITYNQVIKCLISLLGYDMQAKQAGGYPNGYLAVANELGISAASTTDALNYATVAKLVVKAMDTEMMEITGTEGNRVILSSSGNLTPLNVYNKIYYDIGNVTDNGLTGLTADSRFGGNAVVIGNQVLDVGNSDIRDYLGYRVKYYYKEIKDETTLLFVLPYKTNVVTLTDEDINFDNSNFSFNNIYYYHNGKEKNCKIDKYADVIYNGKAYPEYTIDTLKFNQGDMVLIDNDSDGDYDVIRINEYYNVRVSTVDKENEIIYGKFGERVETEKFDVVECLTSKGKISAVGSLTVNQIISVYESKDSGYIRIVSGKDAFTGAVSRVEKNVSKPPVGADADTMNAFIQKALEMKVIVNEKEYSLSYDFIKSITKGYQGVVMPQIGLTYSFRVDANGKIAAVESPSGSQYAYLIRAYYREDDTELGWKSNARLVLQDGTLTTVAFAKKVLINGEKWLGQSEDPDKGVHKHPDFIGEDGNFYKQAVKLRLNSAGEIFEIETAREVTTNPYGYDSRRFTLCYDGSSKYGGHDQRSIDNSYSFPDDVIIFSVPPEDEFDEDEIVVLTESQVTEGTTMPWKLYDCGPSWTVKLAVTQMAASNDWNWGGYIVHSVKTELVDGDTVSKVLYVHDGPGKVRPLYEYKEGIIPDDITTGDICRIVTGPNNKLMNLQLLVSPSKQKTNAFQGASGDTEEWTTYYGQPYAASSTGFTVSFDGGRSIRAFVRNGTATGGKIYDMETNEVQSAQLSDLVSTSPIMEDGTVDLTDSRDMVFFHYRRGWVVSYVLIKNIPY